MGYGYLTTNTLIDDVKRRAMIPENQVTFTDDDFLAFANAELKIGIVPSIMSVHEEYYVTTSTVPLSMGKFKYDIPYRALGGKLRDVFLKNDSDQLIKCSRINPEDKDLFQYTYTNNNFLFYFIQNNSVVLLPTNNNHTLTGTLLLEYFIRPSDLVAENRVATITAITLNIVAGTTTYNVDNIPTGMSASVLVDLLQAKPGHKIRDFDISATAIDSVNKTITFNTSSVDSETEIGDIIAFAGECIIPQCPTDLHSVLSQRVATRCLEALGDTQGLNNANVKLQEMETKTIPLINARVDGSVKKVTNNRGLLRSSRIRRNRWGF